MELEACICPKCGNKGLGPVGDYNCFCGGTRVKFNVTKEEYCNMSDEEENKMIEDMNIHPVIDSEDAYTIYFATKSKEVIDAMIELKQKDVIEYAIKMGQFQEQARQVYEAANGGRKSTQPRCPHCQSPNIKPIGTGERVGSIAVWGIFSKKINKSFKCRNCGYTW